MKPLKATLSPPPPCRKCNNTRHVHVDGAIRRCSCIADYLRGQEYAKAGVSPIHTETPIDELLTLCRLTHLRRVFAEPLRAPYMGCLSVTRINPLRPAFVAAALRLTIDAGRSAKAVSLDQCIANRFDEDERPALYHEFEHTHTLIVDLDVQIVNRMVPQLCMDIFTRRAGRACATVFLAAEPIRTNAARYGVEFVTAFTSGLIRPIKATP